MPSFWCRVKHEERPVTIILELEVEQDGEYTVKRGNVLEVKATMAKLSDKAPVDCFFKPDQFSAKLREYGFDENEVRMQIEDCIEEKQAEEEIL